MLPNSIPATVECQFCSCLNVGRYFFKRRDQKLFMILLTLFNSYPVTLWLLLIVVSDESPVVIPVQKCPDVSISTSRLSLLTDIRVLLLSRGSTWQIGFEKLSSKSFLDPAILKKSRLLIPMWRSHGPPTCGPPDWINFHAVFSDSAYFCISVVVKFFSSKVCALLVKYKALSLWILSGIPRRLKNCWNAIMHDSFCKFLVTSMWTACIVRQVNKQQKAFMAVLTSP